MAELTFVVPWQHLCPDNRKFLSGKFILSAQYRSAKEAVALLATVAAKKGKWKMPSGPMGLAVDILEPDHRKRDILNHSKVVCDAITASGLVWYDDSQIADARWRRMGTDKLKAGATIRLWTLEAK